MGGNGRIYVVHQEVVFVTGRKSDGAFSPPRSSSAVIKRRATGILPIPPFLPPSLLFSPSSVRGQMQPLQDRGRRRSFPMASPNARREEEPRLFRVASVGFSSIAVFHLRLVGGRETLLLPQLLPKDEGGGGGGIQVQETAAAFPLLRCSLLSSSSKMFCLAADPPPSSPPPPFTYVGLLSAPPFPHGASNSYCAIASISLIRRSDSSGEEEECCFFAFPPDPARFGIG